MRDKAVARSAKAHQEHTQHNANRRISICDARKHCRCEGYRANFNRLIYAYRKFRWYKAITVFFRSWQYSLFVTILRRNTTFEHLIFLSFKATRKCSFRFTYISVWDEANQFIRAFNTSDPSPRTIFQVRNGNAEQRRRAQNQKITTVVHFKC